MQHTLCRRGSNPYVSDFGMEPKFIEVKKKVQVQDGLLERLHVYWRISLIQMDLDQVEACRQEFICREGEALLTDIFDSFSFCLWQSVEFCSPVPFKKVHVKIPSGPCLPFFGQIFHELVQCGFFYHSRYMFQVGKLVMVVPDIFICDLHQGFPVPGLHAFQEQPAPPRRIFDL